MSFLNAPITHFLHLVKQNVLFNVRVKIWACDHGSIK